jgi:hypothetical protein
LIVSNQDLARHAFSLQADAWSENAWRNSNVHSNELIAASRQNKERSKAKKHNSEEDKNSDLVDYIVNKKWQELIPLLDSTGIPVNKTVINLLKLYPKEQVARAIALFKTRKREQHIPNPSGYFVAALKGDWGGKAISENSELAPEIDTATVFRHWYDLAKELGITDINQ